MSSCQTQNVSCIFSSRPSYLMARTNGLAVLETPQIPLPDMFFSPELLSRRDSGFGLLFFSFRSVPSRDDISRLAATLGAKSSFKKLPKRSVLTADIAQLCDLIAEPEESLALRLSSNFMVNLARYVSLHP